MRLLTRFLFSLLLMVVAGQSFSAQWSGPTESELKTLPPYCTAKLKPDPALIEIYRPIIGPQLANIHHYCYALNFLNRSYSAKDRREAGSLAAFALSDFNYMTQHLAPGNPSLTAEIYLNRGITLSLLGRDGEAASDMQKAIMLDPRLDKAYDMQATFFSDRHQQAQALGIITQGLRYNPESKRLKRRYQELGGKLPYPEPLVRLEESKPVAEPSTVAPQPPSSATKKVESDSPVPPPEKAQPAMGTTNNPWCRFCPE